MLGDAEVPVVGHLGQKLGMRLVFIQGNMFSEGLSFNHLKGSTLHLVLSAGNEMWTVRPSLNYI